MRIGVCTRPEDLPAGVGGLDFIEPTVAGLLCQLEGEPAFGARLAAARACGAPAEACNCLLPGEMKTTGPDVDPRALDAYMATVCRRAQAAGVRRIVFGAGASRRFPEGFPPAEAAEQVVAHLCRWGELAAGCGVVICFEPLNRRETNLGNRVDEAAELVRRAAHPGARLLVDTYHMALEGDGPDAIRRAGDLIAHVHCAEGNGRGPLGTRGEDQRPFFRALKDAGYDGRVSIEARWDDFAAQLPGALARLREQIETA